MAVLEGAALFLFSLSPVLSFAACLRGNDAEPFPSPACGLEHAQPAEPEALRHPWRAVWTQDWTDKYSRDTRENFESRCWPVAALLPLPHCVLLAAQVSSADSYMLGWYFTVRFPWQQKCTNSVPWMERWVSLQFCCHIPHHLLWQYQEQARHGTEFVSCMAPW